ncbi:hypothetical protein M5K25_006170 [Dendrobium thyrsiflorum]|uniref:Uncharacterized protein n=1 Tax=Dendrobium thyrsiflorum TaxID=117978 RepID=A0ABD0VC66_DENTH
MAVTLKQRFLGSGKILMLGSMFWRVTHMGSKASGNPFMENRILKYSEKDVRFIRNYQVVDEYKINRNLINLLLTCYRRWLHGDGGRKDHNQHSTEVIRTVVSGRWRSKRP